jgi:TfoX/Sxy family transcriptional regulator of competence genes
MAYSEELADRVREVLAERRTREQKMFGGLCFMVDGNMCAGVLGDDLMLRLGEDRADAALDEPHTRPMDFTGRPMKNMVFIEARGTESDADLERWVGRALEFVGTLPPKA